MKTLITIIVTPLTFLGAILGAILTILLLGILIGSRLTSAYLEKQP